MKKMPYRKRTDFLAQAAIQIQGESESDSGSKLTSLENLDSFKSVSEKSESIID